MSKNRPKKTATQWRITWFQVVDGVRHWRWHTGSWYECEVLRMACVAAGETHAMREPGTFK